MLLDADRGRSREHPAPPDWLRRIIEVLTPPQGRFAPRTCVVENLWRKHPSTAGILPRLPAALVSLIVGHAREAFSWKMAIAAACILLIPFLDMLSVAMLLNLALVFGVLILREPYIRPDYRLDREVITTFMTPALIVAFDVLLGLVAPAMMIPIGVILPRAAKTAVPIALCRFRFATDAPREHPHKDLMALNKRTWLFNFLWIGTWIAVYATYDQTLPQAIAHQTFYTGVSAMAALIYSNALQLNPIAGISRHHQIDVTLQMDPYEMELMRKRASLLTGADWFQNFGLQALLEMLSFLILPVPLFVSLWLWHSGDPGAARLDWFQIEANGVAWVVLLLSWHCVKQFNRRTAVPFDRRIHELAEKRQSAQAPAPAAGERDSAEGMVYA